MIAYNTAYFGGAFWSSGNILTKITNTICWGNIPNDMDESQEAINITYSNFEDSLMTGIGNISTTPLFRDPENGDFHLMDQICGDPLNSPCIDAGDPYILDFLIDCDWGLGEYRSDMGAYGGGDSTLVGIDWETELMPDNFILSQNYPNPFNASTTIKYSLPEASEVTITIFDITGRKVDKIDMGVQTAGEHSIIWVAENISSGVYFARMESLEHSSTLKMLLIK